MIKAFSNKPLTLTQSKTLLKAIRSTPSLSYKKRGNYIAIYKSPAPRTIESFPSHSDIYHFKTNIEMRGFN